jgi:hypothetical protein
MAIAAIKAFVILDGTLLPIDPDCRRPALLFGQAQEARDERAGHHRSVRQGDLSVAGPARRGPRH